jgi:hypothetical protein
LFFAIDGGLDGVKSKQGFDDWKYEIWRDPRIGEEDFNPFSFVYCCFSKLFISFLME